MLISLGRLSIPLCVFLSCCMGIASASNFEVKIDDATLSRMAAAMEIAGKGSYPAIISFPEQLTQKKMKLNWVLDVEWKIVSPRISVTPSEVRVQGILHGRLLNRVATVPFDAQADVGVSQHNQRLILKLRRTLVNLRFESESPLPNKQPNLRPNFQPIEISPTTTVQIDLSRALELSVPLRSAAGRVGATALAMRISNIVIQRDTGAIVVFGDIQLTETP